MDEKKEECGYPYADCRFRDELRTLRAENKKLNQRIVEYVKLLADPPALREFIEQQMKIERGHSGKGEK